MTVRVLGSACAVAMMAFAASAFAEDDDAIVLSGELALDLVGVVSGGNDHQVHEVDKTTLTADIDFEKLTGWSGGSGSVTLQHTSTGLPNAATGSLQGINNIEAGQSSTRLFEAWVQQAFGDKGSVRVGLQDLNGEFGVTDSSALLLSPESGMASEIAATGPGGPSIYPKAGLALRLVLSPTENTYFQAAAYNARVGSLGDAGGIDTSFDDGVIQIIEGGWTGAGKLAVGAWRYSKSQDDLFDTDLLGDPIKRTSQGAYIMAEHRLVDGGEMGLTVTGFVRTGVSDGDTGPFRSSWNTGLLIEHALGSRPDSQFSIGYDQAQLGDKYRAASAAGGQPLGKTESHAEITYFDQITEHFSIQPDLQVVWHPGGVASAKPAWVGTIRFGASF